MPVWDGRRQSGCRGRESATTQPGMIIASALILFAQAAIPCTAPGRARRGSGALLVRPIATFEPAPFQRLGPATQIVTRSKGIQQAGAMTATPEADRRTEQCEVVVTPIV